MLDFLKLTEAERTILINQVAAKTGLTAQAIEKDWWVTLVLKALFSLPMSEHFIFKGGTSLSKVWKLVDRFSEDIDIALSPEAFDRKYEIKPSHAYVKNLKREGCAFTNNVIAPALRNQLIQLGVPEKMVSIEAEVVKLNRPDKDPQTLFVRYPSLYSAEGYLLDTIKVEFGVRSLREPFTTSEVISIIGEESDSPAYRETPFTVTAVEPRKTFMEKMMLLHEKYLQGIKPSSAERQSRHLYDLHSMIRKGIVAEVIADKVLYQTLIQHRSYYVRLKGIDYNTMHLHTLTFIPPDEHMDFFRQDYEVMRGQMMYGDVPDFETMITVLRELQEHLIALSIAKK